MFDDINDAEAYFTNLLLTTCKEFIPCRLVKIDPGDKPWMTSLVKNAFKHRDKLHKKWKKSNSLIDLNIYKQSRHHANYVKSLAKLTHYRRIGQKLQDPDTNSKEYWHLVKSLYGTKIDAGIPPLKENDIIFSAAKDKADLLNKHFASKSSLPPDHLRPVLPNNIYETNSRFSELEIVDKDIIDAMKTMKLSGANGPDNISNRILKETITSICVPLKMLFNKSLNTATFPDKWKEAYVTPVFKSGDRQDKSNYRPISLLSNLGKLLERIVFKKLYEYCKENNLLTWRNSGYKKLDSTVNQMIFISHKIYDALSKGEEVCFVSLDASAAFDRVWHDGLIHKLKNKGISGTLLAWLVNYLTDRKQKVVIKGHSSDWNRNTAGVPQGSILGPLLFLIYVDDIVNDIDSQILLFADDASLFEIINDPETSFLRVNNDLEKLSNWASSWLVKFNPNKTKYMIFSKKLVKTDHPPLILNGRQIEKVSSHCQLGIVLHEGMQWNDHVNKICEKAGQRLSAMTRIANKIDNQTKLSIYLSFIRPTLEYGCAIFDNLSQEMAHTLESTQRRAALMITSAYKCTKNDNLLNELGLSPLSERRKYFKLVLFFKMKTQRTPEYLSNLCPPEVADKMTYDLRNAAKIDEIKSTKNYFLKSFLPSTIKLWNNLPAQIKSSNTIEALKEKPSSHLNFQQAYKPYLFSPNRNFIQIGRMRMGLSALNAHRRKYNFIDNSHCSFCPQKREDTMHYLLQCPHYTAPRSTMLNSLATSLPESHRHLTLMTTKHNIKDLTEILILVLKIYLSILIFLPLYRLS